MNSPLCEKCTGIMEDESTNQKTLCPECSMKLFTGEIQIKSTPAGGGGKMTDDHESISLKNSLRSCMVNEYDDVTCNRSRPIVDDVDMTCSACPSQWNITLENGRSIYVRYRWGGFSAEYDDMNDDEDSLIVSKAVGDGFDGCMSTEEMIKIMSQYFNFEKFISIEE